MTATRQRHPNSAGRDGYTFASEWMADVIPEGTGQWEGEHNRGQPVPDVLARRQARRRGR